MVKIYSSHLTDCFRACISSIMEIDLLDFPKLNGDNWTEVLRKYLILKNQCITYYQDISDTMKREPHIIVFKNPYILNSYHAVIGIDNKIVHNPSIDDTFDYSNLPIDYYAVLTKLNL